MAAPMSQKTAMSLFKRMNYFKKLPEDLTISTAHGSVMTIVGLIAMVVLFGLELSAFLDVKVETAIEVDDTVDTMIRVNFNLTVDDIPCEFVSADMTDATGTYEHNITRRIQKTRLSALRRQIAIHPEMGAGKPAYVLPSDDELAALEEKRIAAAAERQAAEAQGADTSKLLDVHGNPHGEVVALSESSLADYVRTHDMVFVNFFAPWCHWCRELEPIWDAAAAKLPELHYGEHVKMASVDCVAHVEFCRTMHIRAFPTLTLYSDHTMDHSLLYRSTRSTEAILDFVETNAQRHHVPHEDKAEHESKVAALSTKQTHGHGPEACMMSGVLVVKKVPGAMHIKLHSPQYSHAAELMNASHVLHHLSFGGAPDESAPLEKRQSATQILNVGRSQVADVPFVTDAMGRTFVHYHKVVAKVRQKLNGATFGSYAYTMHSSTHEEVEEALPAIKFVYDFAPMKVVYKESSTPTYHFVTSLCAIIGGFFTLLSLAESSIHFSIETISKKLM